MTDTDRLIAGIELGGTKCIAVVARGSTILRIVRYATGQPEETLRSLLEQLAQWRPEFPFDAIGVASFGPIVVDPDRPDFGRIVNTPKPGWSGTDIKAAVREYFDLPIAIDTDVAGAALAEGLWGHGVGCDVHLYVTIGTGVGAGIVIDGNVLHGAFHPEVGHIKVPRRSTDEFAGICPFHGDCIEGLVSGPAISARAGEPVATLPVADPVWDAVAEDIAGMMAMLILTLSPHRIIIGGGVAQRRPMLFARIHAATHNRLNGYLSGQEGHDLQRLIVPPKFGPDAGPLGAIAVGLTAL